MLGELLTSYYISSYHSFHRLGCVHFNNSCKVFSLIDVVQQPNLPSFEIETNVTGSGKRDIFVHIFKIELLVPQGRVSS